MSTNVIKKILVFIVLLLILIPIKIEAYTVTSGSKVSAGLSYANIKKIDDSIVICTQFDKKVPKTCSATTTLSAAVNAGAGYIANWYNKGGNYVCAEKLMTKFMYNYYDTTGRSDYNCNESWTGACSDAEDIYDNATKEYQMVNNISNSKIEYDKTKLEFSESGDYYVATVKVTPSTTNYSVKCSVNVGTVSLNKNTATIKVDKSNSNTTVTLSCQATYNYNSPKAYYTSCGSGSQTLISASTKENIVYSNKSEVKGTTPSSTGTLKIMKYDINGGNITFPSDYRSDPNADLYVSFYIYYLDGQKVFTEPTKIDLENSNSVTVKLSPGTYTIKEDQAPYGYDPSENEITVTIKKGTTTTVKFYNKKKEATCYERAIETTNDPVGRIALYQEYKTKGKNYTNLLNFSYKGNDVCSQASCLNDQMNVGCLSVSNKKNSFSYNNLSCYDETITVGSYTGYCQVTYNLSNNLTGTFEYTETHNFGDNFLSGMMILNRTAQNSLVAQGTLVKTCFVYGNNIGSTVIDGSGEYSSYVGNVTFNGENLTSSEIANTGWIKTPLSTGYNRFQKMIKYNYYLNPVYSEILSGKTECEDSNLCRLLGYGFVSKLNSKGEQTVEFSIKLENKLKNLNNETNITSKACIYSLNSGLIDEELQLEFRTISKFNPFPGKSGDTTRKVGSNWCDGDNCTSSNNIVESVIRNSNDSYDSLNKGPIYRIELNSETIRDIRDYNNGKKYDEYDLECDADATNCKSTFLEHYGITRLQ